MSGIEDVSVELEQSDEQQQNDRRELLNSIFSLLKLLALYDIHNDSLIRPKEMFERAWGRVRRHEHAKAGVELKFEDAALTICSQKIPNHFSIVEALRFVPEAMTTAMIESLTIDHHASAAELFDFFSQWALHVNVHQKPKALTAQGKGVRIKLIDPSKANARLKSKSLMMQPSYALKHYYLLFEATEKVFRGIYKGEILPQREIRRSLYEMSEIASVNPYTVVALSLLRRSDPSDQSGIQLAVSEAIATSCLVLGMAQKLEMSLKEQVNVAMAGLLYNVGLLSEELSQLTRSQRKLSSLEYKRVLDAQSAGVLTLIRAQGASRPVLERLLALFEATQSATHNSISLTLESRLLRLCSNYIALTTDRPYRDAYTPSEAMKILGSRAATKSDEGLEPVLYYMFARFLGMFPVGSLVLLSSGEKAVVYRPQGEKAGVPLVKKMSSDPDGRSLLVDLAQFPQLNILRSLDGKREGIHVPGYFFE
jgi:hypothetical protein